MDAVNAKTAAQVSLAELESEFAKYGAEEQEEIQALRMHFRHRNKQFPASAALAMMATCFEIAIERGQ